MGLTPLPLPNGDGEWPHPLSSSACARVTWARRSSLKPAGVSALRIAGRRPAYFPQGNSGRPPKNTEKSIRRREWGMQRDHRVMRKKHLHFRIYFIFKFWGSSSIIEANFSAVRADAGNPGTSSRSVARFQCLYSASLLVITPLDQVSFHILGGFL